MAELSFHGGVREVTGSCYLFEYQDTSVLIDCGMHQGEQKMCASINREEFDFAVSMQAIQRIEKLLCTLNTEGWNEHCTATF
jgi:metallo-beta-lactamase family protein